MYLPQEPAGAGRAGTLPGIPTDTFFSNPRYSIHMASQFGHGFIVSLMHISRHLALPPEKAFYGMADHIEGLVIPPALRGTEVEERVTLLKKKVLWHQPGPLDREEHRDISMLLADIAVSADRILGIPDADIGEFQ